MRRRYAGVDFAVGDLQRVVDVNPRPSTSIVGIAKVMCEELVGFILRAKRVEPQLPAGAVAAMGGGLRIKNSERLSGANRMIGF